MRGIDEAAIPDVSRLVFGEISRIESQNKWSAQSAPPRPIWRRVSTPAANLKALAADNMSQYSFTLPQRFASGGQGPPRMRRVALIYNPVSGQHPERRAALITDVAAVLHSAAIE